MHNKDFKKFFSSIKVTSKIGGSVASDNVMNCIKGGKRFNYRLHHGASPPMGIPIDTLSHTVDNMSSSMTSHTSQPLTPNIPFTNNIVFPSYYTSFYPLLTQSGGCGNKK